tara:strand:+ start:4857 stop:5333 length:477 start_codon:yes stop_codon:yes gene_type:complete
MKLDGFQLLGRMLGMDIYIKYYDRKYLDVTVLDRRRCKKDQKKVVINLELYKEPGYDNTYSIMMIRVDSQYKGFNLAKKLYKFLLSNIDGFTLMSGNQQSAGGRHIWNELGKDKKISLSARKSTYSKIFGQPVTGLKQLVCPDFPLYDNNAILFARRV